MTETQAHPTATPGSVVVVLTDICDWQESVRDAARLAAATGRRLRVVVADGGEILTAANLDCVRLLAAGGGVSAFDPLVARRLLRAQMVRLRQGLAALAARLGIEAELSEPKAAPDAAFWAGSTALALFARRRRGVIMVVHAGTATTLEVAARLAVERQQMVHLVTATASGGGRLEPAELRRLFGPWLRDAPEALGEAVVLRRPRDATAIAALVIDPAWLERSRLSLASLREQWLGLRATASGQAAPSAEPSRSAKAG
jgi:hypothetical protein